MNIFHTLCSFDYLVETNPDSGDMLKNQLNGSKSQLTRTIL